MGISPDPEERVARFGMTLEVPYELGSDKTQELCKLYDVQRRFGLGVSRVTYIIDANSIIRAVFHNEFSMAGHVRNALKALDDLQ